MTMKMQGLMTALVTPFREDRIDEPAYRNLVERQIKSGVSALVPCGTTGEAATMTQGERERVITATLEVSDGRVPVLAGAGTNSTRATIDNARRAEALGASGVLVVTPYYNKPSQEGLYRHFRAVAESVSCDVCLYNVPGRTGVRLEPATIRRLATVANITGIKEATGDLNVASEIMLQTGDHIRMLSGDDFTAMGFLAQGGHGVISVTSNVVPDKMAALVNAALRGDRTRASKLHLQLYPLFRSLFLQSNPIPVKAALAEMGLIRNELRLPLCPMSDVHRSELEHAMAALGLLGRSR